MLEWNFAPFNLEYTESQTSKVEMQIAVQSMGILESTTLANTQRYTVKPLITDSLRGR